VLVLSCDSAKRLYHLHILVLFSKYTATTEIYTLSLHDALPILMGHRVGPIDGFSAVVVTPDTAPADLTKPQGLLIAADIASDDDLTWARAIGADLLEGPAVAEPMRVAPVDLSRLRR